MILFALFEEALDIWFSAYPKFGGKKLGTNYSSYFQLGPPKANSKLPFYSIFLEELQKMLLV